MRSDSRESASSSTIRTRPIATSLARDGVAADEPVSSVDPTRARDTVALLRDVCEEEGLTLLASLHDLEIAREYFPRLVGLRAGRIVFDRAPGEVDSESMRALYEIEERAPNGR
jgi:phosphonate transport system ATP-binding protein